MKHVILFFGSFDPVHKGHVALAEYAIERKLGDEVVLIVSPQNPFKCGKLQAPEVDRFAMAEAACAASKYPEQIKASAVEFLLEKPSYTINTLRFLQEQCGTEMRFSILMGDDLLPKLPEWREATEILRNYPILVYPRAGATDAVSLEGNITRLSDAPTVPYSSTEVRERLQRGEMVDDMLPACVVEYIREKGLWSPTAYIASLTAQIEQRPDEAALYLERGQWHFRRNEWGNALNDFNRALKIDPANEEAKQFVDMVYEILSFRYKDIYNP